MFGAHERGDGEFREGRGSARESGEPKVGLSFAASKRHVGAKAWASGSLREGRARNASPINIPRARAWTRCSGNWDSAPMEGLEKVVRVIKALKRSHTGLQTFD